MKYTKISLGILLSIVMICSSACKKELDVAPYATFDGKATHTIAQLLQFHPLTEGFTYDTIPQGVIIQGVVISSDKEGNCYKYITIDDGTAGVQIKINSSSLYTNYPLGQRVFVKCDGLVLGDYGMLHQLGWWENGSMQGISTNRLSRYIFRDNLPGATPAPIELNSAYEIEDNMYNRLVKIKNCHFENPGHVYAETTSSGTSNTIVFADGSEIVLYTSAYAKFASQLTPEGTFDMVAILSRFRTTKQLVLRSLDDLGTPHVDPVIHEKVVFNMDLSQNPLQNGWSNVTSTETNWEYLPSASTCMIQGRQGNNDSWLISPVIDATSYDNVSLSLTHRSINGTNGRRLYYSTSYNGGEINPADWTEIDLGTIAQGYTTFTYDIDEEIFSQQNLRFALRYTDNTNSTWIVSSFNLISYVLE